MECDHGIEALATNGFNHSLDVGSPVGGNIEVKNAAAVTGQHQEHVKKLETADGDGEKLDRDPVAGHDSQGSYATSERAVCGSAAGIN